MSEKAEKPEETAETAETEAPAEEVPAESAPAEEESKTEEAGGEETPAEETNEEASAEKPPVTVLVAKEEEEEAVEFPARVLHIDDDETERTIVKAIFDAMEGVEFESYEDGKSALDCVRMFKPELILLDLKMPDATGPDVLNLLRDIPEAAKIPVIFLTGVEKMTMEDSYKQLGVIGVMHKPVSAESLTDKITELWPKAKSA